MTSEPKIPDPTRPAGRVLVLLDGSRLSLDALEAAADLAHSRGAEVLGIFVEEVNLLRSAGYGFAREVGASSGQARPLDSAHIEARMHALAEQARRSLAQAMSRRGIPQTLKLCRGQVVQEVLGLASPEDLLVLGRVGWSAAPGSRIGSTARSLVRQAPGDVLLWTRPRQRPQGRVVVLLNHDQGANHRAVRVGADLALQYHQPLSVLVRTTNGDHQRVTEDLLSYLQQQGIAARIRLLPMASASAVTRALQEEGASQLVISRTCSLFSEPGADNLLMELSLPLTVTP
ncbi:Nucleotide-binding universal stress protein, UspA family [Marinobacter segnicrescens]|uniref:Nucleotide-binding universal stress protein, UspA family n=1 Tax=Marinobacter segnicrescens TaxID=430453 RepID=A0A1H9YHC6_9GAMM|nr:universal stress protein [Marinobacter segnicrescens]SES68400.1 Nucleotide-binding universal stress protein, UspA family [Marinobacter segnicrescens]